ncbi:9456_t:CDS:2 [Paraglomus occultum]|uniref:9456_t:CDS:1 n=1 Tax=Paraglomus occultum TaxID=144539 RepID=A0A9N9BUM4_9GLOM|nr:9456_t:CDS:2 [Paraglomus occultum]
MLRGYTQAESRKISELGKNVLVLSDIVNTMREMSQVNSKKNPDAKVSLLRETESLINTRQNTEYSDDVETLWVNYKILINQKVKKENRSLTQTFKVLGKKIKLSSATLAGFYRHQTNPQRSTLDKIKKWVDEEGENSNLRKQE